MKKIAYLILIGVTIGAVSWGGTGVFSGKFEPFDSDIGFYLNQLILSVGALYVGYKNGIIDLLIYILATHIGMNFYAYVMGGPEQKAWWLLGIVTTTALLVYPLISGLSGMLVKIIKIKYGK